jgi:O-acetyl-ADP-ribose deacetylase (regulator of RNase III)
VRVEIVIGNTVRQPDVHALVNSANVNLRFGSGVAGAIHTAAGPEPEQYCRRYSPIALGDVVVTPGFELPNPYSELSEKLFFCCFQSAGNTYSSGAALW